jgi:hypothetical protein
MSMTENWFQTPIAAMRIPITIGIQLKTNIINV